MSSEKLAYLRERLAAKRSEFVLHGSHHKHKSGPKQTLARMTDTEADDVFFELFAGDAGLTRAVKRLPGRVLDPRDVTTTGRAQTGVDLSNKTVFVNLKKLIKHRQVRWVHFSPPHRTFSKVKRKDRNAGAKRLRTARQPSGVGQKSRPIKEANLMAARSAQLALLQWKAGGLFSLENPAGSLIWKYKPVARLTSLKNVMLIFGDQCGFMGEHVKPTGWLTNAPFLRTLERTCPGSPQHVHKPFAGNKRVVNVWPTEYPQGLCEHVAAAFAEFLKQQPVREDPWHLHWTTEGTSNALFSKRAKIEQENENALGGLRNPCKAVRQLPGWTVVGKAVCNILEAVKIKCSDLTHLTQLIGTDKAPDMQVGLQFLADTLNGSLRFGCRQDGLWGSALEALVAASGDPDRETATWPRLGTPLGIVETIHPSGVFPLVEPGEAASYSAYDSGLLEGAWENYTSYEENKEAADELLQAELDKGFLEWAPNISSLEHKYGKLVPSAIGVIVKQKPGAKKKVRLVHDLRRSLVNAQIWCPERLVLPRLRDVVSDVLDLLESKKVGEQVMIATLDFSDAFKHLQVRRTEQRFLAGQAKEGFFVYKTVLFGVKTGPLVWGRMAGLIARSTQALFSDDSYRLQVFVDDPIIVAKGTSEEIKRMVDLTLIWWSVLGLRIAWNKGTFGEHGEWIGAEIAVDNLADKIVLTVPSEKICDWRELLASLHTKPLVSKKKLQKLAGKLTWAAGLATQLRPFVRMLHAALAKTDNSAHSDKFVYFRQVAPAFEWISKFLNGFSHGLRWEVRAHWRHMCSLDFLVDASPWGGGAVRLDETGSAIETLAIVWTHDDEKLTGAKIGEAGSQAIWECYMLLRCLHCWMNAAMQGFVRVRGDAQGVLASVVKKSASAPLLNRVVREITLHLALNFTSIEALHVWSEDNIWADKLSRGECPPELRGVSRVVDPPNLWRFQ